MVKKQSLYIDCTKSISCIPLKATAWLRAHHIVIYMSPGHIMLAVVQINTCLKGMDHVPQAVQCHIHSFIYGADFGLCHLRDFMLFLPL